MGDKHVVRFEPVGIEIEVDEDQTILRAAAEQGVQLMHGCKEGQCAACKSFVLEGEDIELDRYSTFALPDFERDEGQTLLCRAHAYEDLVIELLNYDEEIIRGGLPLRKGTVEVVSNQPVTARPAAPGRQARRARGDQVLPRPVHGLRRAGHGRDPVVLDGEHAQPGRACSSSSSRSTRAGCSRSSSPRRCSPATSCRWRRRSAPSRCARAARRTCCSSAAARAWRRCSASCARWPSAGSTGRSPSTTARGPSRTCASSASSRSWPSACPTSRYVPALSHAPDDDGWAGERGLITDVVKRRETGLAGMDAYVCGPPPMVDAAIATLTALGVKENNIHYDKFTTTGEPEA